MSCKTNILLVILVLLNLMACSDSQEDSKKNHVLEVHNGYIATLAEGIQFSEKPDYPAFIKSVAGMSSFEAIGRWTEGKNVTFVFAQNLPAKFTLDLEFAPAFGPDVGKVVKIEVGDWKNQFIASEKPKKETFIIETSLPTDTIKFVVPVPLSPVEMGIGTDPREVGIMFRRLSIISDAINPAVATTMPVVKPIPVETKAINKAVIKPVDVKGKPIKKTTKAKKKNKQSEVSSLAQ